MKIIILSGGFDPCHSGHIAMINAARDLGDLLVVGVNSDAWLQRKKGQAFMPWTERATIIANLRAVDQVVEFNDADNTACDLIEQVNRQYPAAEIVFANGGDRTQENIPEMRVAGVEFIFGVGGDNKMNSSSWILQEWKAPKTERQWGYYRVLHEAAGMKVKELTVDPGKMLSMQRHSERAEYWIVEEGSCAVNAMTAGGYQLPPRMLSTHEEYKIAVGEWHQLTNPFSKPCRIVEIQYGTNCIEEDIERK
jgi:cytidyltransferase-like protein